MDLAVTKDDVLVVSHDPILHAPVCSGPRENAVIREMTFRELGRWDCGATQNPRFPFQKPVPGTRIPTLHDVFQLSNRGTFDYHIEIKSFPGHPQFAPPPEEFARLVLEEIRRFRLERRVAVLSFDFRTLVAMRKLAPEIRLSALTETDPRDFALIAQDAADAEIVSPAVHLATGEKVAAAHAAGLPVVPWTANAPQDWELLIKAQVDAIVTDDPAALIEYLEQRGLR